MPRVWLFLVHHGAAVGPELDARRPLSDVGSQSAARVAEVVASHGARPVVVWHSGKLRAKQTAEIFWRACNALAEFSAVRDLQPDDPPMRMRDRLRHEARDVLIAGHFPYLPRLLSLLRGGVEGTSVSFPIHGVVALETLDDGETWTERWRVESDQE
jgi:phosphohistidine phosphatase